MRIVNVFCAQAIYLWRTDRYFQLPIYITVHLQYLHGHRKVREVATKIHVAVEYSVYSGEEQWVDHCVMVERFLAHRHVHPSIPVVLTNLVALPIVRKETSSRTLIHSENNPKVLQVKERDLRVERW